MSEIPRGLQRLDSLLGSDYKCRTRFDRAQYYILLPDYDESSGKRVLIKPSHEFLSNFMQRLRYLEDTDGLIGPIASVCFTPESSIGRLVLNPNNTADMPLAELSGVLVHELVHVAKDHVLGYWDETREAPVIWSYAIDIEANHDVEFEFKYPLPDHIELKDQWADEMPDPPYLDRVSLDRATRLFQLEPKDMPPGKPAIWYYYVLLKRYKELMKQQSQQQCPACGGAGTSSQQASQNQNQQGQGQSQCQNQSQAQQSGQGQPQPGNQGNQQKQNQPGTDTGSQESSNSSSNPTPDAQGQPTSSNDASTGQPGNSPSENSDPSAGQPDNPGQSQGPDSNSTSSPGSQGGNPCQNPSSPSTNSANSPGQSTSTGSTSNSQSSSGCPQRASGDSSSSATGTDGHPSPSGTSPQTNTVPSNTNSTGTPSTDPSGNTANNTGNPANPSSQNPSDSHDETCPCCGGSGKIDTTDLIDKIGESLGHDWKPLEDLPSDLRELTRKYAAQLLKDVVEDDPGAMPGCFAHAYENAVKILRREIFWFDKVDEWYGGTGGLHPYVNPRRFNKKNLLGRAGFKQFQTVACILDVSGSVSNNEFGLFMGTLLQLMERSESEVYVVECDTEIACEPYFLSEVGVKEEYIRHACGGTILNPAFEHIHQITEIDEEEEFGGLIVMTDGGLFNWPDPKTVPDNTLWVIVRMREGQFQLPPGMPGEVVYFDFEQKPRRGF